MILIIYLVLKGAWSGLFVDSMEFYPNRLRLVFENFYKPGPSRLNSIVELLKKYEHGFNYSYLLKEAKKISSFYELSHSRKFIRGHPDLWRVRAMGVLEVYLDQHGTESYLFF